MNRFPTQMDRIETATQKYSAMMISNAIKATGTVCDLYRLKKDRVADTVYGVHGGTDLSRIPSTSVYDKPITLENIDEVDIFDHELGNATNYNLEESIDDSYEKVIQVTVLLNTVTWRAISGQSASLLEDPGYAYCISDVTIENGDVLLVVSESHQIKFKVYYPELIGNTKFMVFRFRLTNVQE